ncbi:MAG: signal peptidase I [Bacteroidales bacterium]|nr:signal peptidase I [Bacteroidales bacterium]
MSRRKKFRTKSKVLNWILDWVDAILFAVVVVTLINVFWFQSFKIPSSSMESSLYTGDHLFVSKLTYGARLPLTPLTIPFTHNVIGSKESYSTSVQWKYRRLPGFREVRKGDCVVFGFPNGDTVLTKAPVEDYHTVVRFMGRETAQKAYGPVIVRPMDKKDHYVKRCVATPGDTLEVRDGLVWINGEQQTVWPGVQLSYRVITTGRELNPKVVDQLGLNASELRYSPALPGYPEMPLTAEMLAKVKEMKNVVSVEPVLQTESADYREIFPFSPLYSWSRDSFGPLWIPRKGATVEITPATLPLYERIIRDYEHSDVNAALAVGSYTFKQDYYFMMGDNRHNSLDSRYWGFVPEDHIVGRPAVIWLSTDKGRSFPSNIRWRRFLKFL